MARCPWLDLAAIGLMRLVPARQRAGDPRGAAGDVARRRPPDARRVASVAGCASLPGVGAVAALLRHRRRLVVPGAAGAAARRCMCALTVAGASQLWASAEPRSSRSRGAARGGPGTRSVAEPRAQRGDRVRPSTSGWSLLDRDGAYRVGEPAARASSCELAYPDGHDGRAGQLGLRLRARTGSPLLGREEMPTVRAIDGEQFSDCVIWVGEDPADQRALSVSATPVLDATGEFDGAVLGLPGHHRPDVGAEDQGRLRRLGLPRAADAADLDHGLPRPGPRRGGRRRSHGARRSSPSSSATPSGCSGWSATCCFAAQADGGPARPRRRAAPTWRRSPGRRSPTSRPARAPEGVALELHRPAAVAVLRRRPGADPAGASTTC